ncbi:hypothetical protein RhiXN_02624 [Rhizoctonia solani]|uniref:Uncharacterized protein n=1 Tax=Rhizoctonia solani TaxID=456999 RepID=A0A8H8NSA2_9AGAM|nr:uncharacterized protein RhiXN_02624 [Rhizoctonia solani]QRW17700.1 hypothetical protein RhiXN_02624 [Rhizoctonia solani]
MDVDQPLMNPPEHFDEDSNNEKKRIDLATSPAVVSTPSTLEANVPAPTTGVNLSTDLPSQLRELPTERSIDKEKLETMIRAERKSIGFDEGVRRESFPGKHLHTPDVSFNCEEAFIGDKSYSSDVAHDEGMSFIYNARSSTPVAAHKIPLPSTVQRTRPDSDAIDESHQIKAPVDELESSPIPLKPRIKNPRSPLAFEVTNAGRLGDSIPSKSPLDPKPDSISAFEFIPPKLGGSSERTHAKNGPIPSMSGLKAMAARAAALRFILPDESLMEMIQYSMFSTSSSGSQTTKPRSMVPEPSKTLQKHQPEDPNPQNPSATAEQDSRSGTSSAQSASSSDEAGNSYPEDEQTLNLASLGLSRLGDTLLVDMSLDQLRPKLDDPERGNATFGGSSFVLANSSAAERHPEPTLEAQTPKRIASNPLPLLEDVGANVEGTVKKSRSTNGRVVSDAVIDALRSGRALHRVTASIPGFNNDVLLADGMTVTDETPIRQVWPGSTASLRRAESFASYSNIPESRQHPGSAVLQKTRSTVSLRRTSSVISNQPDFMRPHSRISVADVDSEDDQPFASSAPMASRGSSRRSSVYAFPEPGISNDYPGSHLERPSSVASSIYDRPTSAASMRPTSAASIRSSSTRPTSVAGSLRSGSATSSRRVSGAHLQPSYTPEDELVSGMEALMKGDIGKAPAPAIATRNAQESQIASSARITSGFTKDTPGTARSGIRQPTGLTTPRVAKSGLALKTVGSKVLSGVPGSKHQAGPGASSTVIGTSNVSKTMSAASGRSVHMTPAPGTRSATSTLRSQSSSTPSAARLRASTLGLFAPDGGPAAGQDPKRLTHKASSSSISVTPSVTRTLRAPASTSNMRIIGARGASGIAAPRTATKAGSIASLREVMKPKEVLKR